MSPERAERRPKSVRKHIRRLKEEVRRDPEFEQRAIPLLRQKLENFDVKYGAHLGILEEIFIARREIQITRDTSPMAKINDKYSNPDSPFFNPEHPDILGEIKPATDVIVGIFTRR